MFFNFGNYKIGLTFTRGIKKSLKSNLSKAAGTLIQPQRKTLTLLSVVDDRNQISSLVFAVRPGILPVLSVIPHNYFVALCKQDEFALCVRITIKGTVGKPVWTKIWFKYIWEFKSHWEWKETFVLITAHHNLCYISLPFLGKLATLVHILPEEWELGPLLHW